MKVWAFVPARGGSKSILKKNLANLGGRPLMDYGVNAAVASGICDRIVCSTDDDEIAERSQFLGIEVDRRPCQLATDDAPVADVVQEFLERAVGALPDFVALIQPTSPFLKGDQLKELVRMMVSNPAAKSGQTVYPVPHNHHAWNQRLVVDGAVNFMFAKERAAAYNKQKKPKLYVFGNLVVARPKSLMEGSGFFATPSVALDISWPYNLDVDGPDDLQMAECLLRENLVELDRFTFAL